ncbi:MAG: hypothetical protein R3B07_18275 [Polyangiaceae bacterium]
MTHFSKPIPNRLPSLVALVSLLALLLGCRLGHSKESRGWDLLDEHHRRFDEVAQMSAKYHFLDRVRRRRVPVHFSATAPLPEQLGRPEYAGLDSYDASELDVVDGYLVVSLQFYRFTSESAARAAELDLRGAKETPLAKTLVPDEVYGVARRATSLLVVSCRDGDEAGSCADRTEVLQRLIPATLHFANDAWLK